MNNLRHVTFRSLINDLKMYTLYRVDNELNVIPSHRKVIETMKTLSISTANYQL